MIQHPQIMLEDHPIGFGNRPFIVAEVGINHQGNLDQALEMIHVAKTAGCDAVKFQTFKAVEFVNDPSQLFTYWSQGNKITESMQAMFQRYELPKGAWEIIKAECSKVGIIFFSTPQNISDLDILLEVGVPAIKVGSDDLTNLPLLQRFSESGLPLILSAGMSNLAEIYQALEIVGGLDGYPVCLLVCTSQYPTPPEDANLARISVLRNSFPMIPIGFSDHTRGTLASVLAVGLGAVLLEKHFTLSQDLPGPDHWFSEDPIGLTEWVKSIRIAHQMIGSPLVRPTSAERANKLEFQRYVVAARDIEAGEILETDSMTARRVAGGFGLPPIFISYLIGRRVRKPIRAGEPIDL